MSTATHKATSIATAVDTYENTLNNINNSMMKAFEREQRVIEEFSGIGTITDVTFVYPIEDIISDTVTITIIANFS